MSLHPFFELGALLVLLTAAVFGPVLPHLGFQPRRNRTKLAAVLGIMAATPFFFLLVARRFGVDGEPFTLLAGVSLWPTEVIRTWVIALALTLLVHVWRTLPVNAATIAAECRWSTSVPSPHALCLEVFRAWRTFRIPPSLQITQWENDPNNQAKNAGELWAEYMIRSSFVPFAVRVGLSSLSFMCTAWVVIGVFGPPFVPYRGHWVKWIDLGVLGCAILSILMLSFSVVDATRLCVAFVRQLCRLEHPWDPEVLSEVKARWETGDLAATERLRMTVIAERSTVVARFVVYPAVVIALMMAARSAFFDDWGMPVALIAVFALFGVFVIGSAMILRNATQQAHTVALTRLRERVWVLRGRLTARALSERRSLLAAIECIEDMPHSAFASIFKSPVLAALLVPSGSFGILSLLEAWYAFQGK